MTDFARQLSKCETIYEIKKIANENNFIIKTEIDFINNIINRIKKMFGLSYIETLVLNNNIINFYVEIERSKDLIKVKDIKG